MNDLLLLRLKNGDEQVFEQIYKTYYIKVVSFISGLTKSHESAEDIAQDVFISLWTNRENINTEKNVNNYLFVMARNAAFNYLKRENKSSSLDQSVSEILDDVTPEQEYYAKEIALLYEMAINLMPEQRKKIYLLKRSGLENDEIAQKLNITKKTVENQLSLATRDLKQALVCILVCVFY